MRAVVDTNLLVSGLLWRGNPGRLLDAVADGRVQLFISNPLLAELAEVLQREKFAARLALAGITSDAALATVQTVARIVAVANIPVPALLRDADDAHVLACAVGAAADVIVSGDRDLLALGNFGGIPILRAKEVLERLELDV